MSKTEVNRKRFDYKAFLWSLFYIGIPILGMYIVRNGFVGLDILDIKGEMKLFYTALNLAGLTGVLIILLYSKLASKFTERVPAEHQYHLGSIVFMIFMTLFVVWFAVGLLPTAIVIEARQKSIDAQKDKGPQKADVPKEKVTIPEIEMNPGIIGDQFGMVNSMFSGLALGGVVLAVIIQSIDLRHQQAQHREAIAAQQMQLDEAKKAQVNNYHLQAMETYLNSGLYEKIEDPDNEDVMGHHYQRVHMYDDILQNIKRLRESGHIDPMFMNNLRKRVAIEMARLDFDGPIYFPNNKCDREEINNLIVKVQSIDEQNVGNGVLNDLISKLKEIKDSDTEDSFEEIKEIHTGFCVAAYDS